ERRPGVPGLCEEGEIFRTVDSRARPLPERDRLDQLMPALLDPPKQSIGALGLLGRALDDAAHQEELRIMAAGQLGIDGVHSGRSVIGKLAGLRSKTDCCLDPCGGKMQARRMPPPARAESGSPRE